MADQFPEQYKEGLNAANRLLADGAKRIMTICEEVIDDFGEGRTYELELHNPNITIRIIKGVAT